LTVYIAEAHPDDEWQTDSNREEQLVFQQPKSFDERKELARILVERLRYRMPLAIDSIENRAEQAFAAWPERIYILGRRGTVLYKGGMGPFGFDPEEARKALAGVLG
jgi:Iodothyronine deiodinase